MKTVEEIEEYITNIKNVADSLLKSEQEINSDYMRKSIFEILVLRKVIAIGTVASLEEFNFMVDSYTFDTYGRGLTSADIDITLARVRNFVYNS